jgi:hypothetical protein
MNLLASVVSDYLESRFPTAPIMTAKAFFHYLADEHLVHLHTQRNIAQDREEAKRSSIARHRIKQFIEKYCLDDTDAGLFNPYCFDIRPTNMLVEVDEVTDDPKITAVLDFEFTNTFPAQFASDPPWWLFLISPAIWFDGGYKKRGVESWYEPLLERSLKAMEKEEAILDMQARKGFIPLSLRMRDSWDSGRFWFDYTIKSSWEVDAVYWGTLHKPGDEILDEGSRTLKWTNSVLTRIGRLTMVVTEHQHWKISTDTNKYETICDDEKRVQLTRS